MQGLLGLMKAFSVEIVVFQSQSTLKKEKAFQLFSSFKVKVNITLAGEYICLIYCMFKRVKMSEVPVNMLQIHIYEK